ARAHAAKLGPGRARRRRGRYDDGGLVHVIVGRPRGEAPREARAPRLDHVPQRKAAEPPECLERLRAREEVDVLRPLDPPRRREPRPDLGIEPPRRAEEPRAVEVVLLVDPHELAERRERLLEEPLEPRRTGDRARDLGPRLAAA